MNIVNHSKIVLSATIVIILIVGVGTAAGIGNVFADVQRVSFDDVKYEQSELKVDTVDLLGPGTTVQEVEIRVDISSTNGPTEATVEAWLLADGTEQTYGTATYQFKQNDDTVVIELDSEIRESAFDTVDIRIVEVMG